MIWEHFKAFLWLRWRLLMNQWRRAGQVNAIIMIVVSVVLIVAAIPSLIGFFALGTYAIPQAKPVHLMLVWDGLVLAFLFFWGLGLVTDLQRTEPLSLTKFMHLPVSANWAFLINYLSSLLRLSLLMFVPVMLSYCLALIYTQGVKQVTSLLLLSAFLLMITALTYQFQGWLGSLMKNPRYRRTVVVATTAAFVLLMQLPNLINILGPWRLDERAKQSNSLVQELGKLNQEFNAKKFDAKEFVRRQNEAIEKNKAAAKKSDHEALERAGAAAEVLNTVLPIGWLPLGVMAAAEGRVLPSILGTLGMALIGVGSLWKSYRSTVRVYQGQPTSQSDRRKATASTPTEKKEPGTILLETRLPWLSEPVSAIALAGLRSLIRAPETKMVLLTPIIFSAIFGSMLLKDRNGLPDALRPLAAVGAMGVVLLGLLQLMVNQFGLDRDGFRVYVLSSAPRRDILLGKNLSFVPLAFGMALVLLAILQVIRPARLDRFLAMPPQFVSMFLMCCLLMNMLSIYTPLQIPSGTLKPNNVKLTTVLMQTVMFLVIFPITQAAMMLPLGLEALFRYLGWSEAIPTLLLVSLVQCAVIIPIYLLSLRWQGELLQAREQKILEVVTGRAI